MQNTSTRILSLLLVLVMVLSMVPTAFAAEDSVSVTYVAENTTTGVQYADMNEAIAAAQAGQTVKALANAESVVYSNEGVILDLNGYDLSVTVADGVTLSAIDSATDDYEGAYGSLTTDGQVAATVKTAEPKSYVAIAENGSYTFHRYYAAIAAISLKPTDVALGYRAEFRGDEAVKNAVTGYGYEMWLNGGAHKVFTQKDALEKSSLTLRLKNILSENNNALNALGSTATIGGNAFITLNLNGEEVTLYGTEQETTLRQVVEAVNANVGSYGEAQLQSVRDMIDTYISWMEGWKVEAIFGLGNSDAPEGDLKVEITVDVTAENGVLTQDATLSNDDITVTVPQGTVLEDGTTQLVLTIIEKAYSDSDITAEENETLIPLDVHIEGISADNTTPIVVCLGEVLPKGLNIGNYELYHVENGKTVPMTRVYSVAELDTHNEFCYNPATGAVTVAMASFSEITVTANEENPWDGTVVTDWYNDTDSEFILYNAQQLAGLGKLVDEGNTFDGKKINLGFHINLFGEDANQERISFDPIGYGYDIVFKGSFDGQGYTISNLYQNGWALGLSYSTAGGGLFASVVDADFANLNIDGAEVVMECIDMGTLVGYAYGTCSFSNIVVSNTVVANYNRYTGGVVGEVNGNHTFYNVDVADTTTLSALWGTFDPSIGGIIGGKWGDATVYMEKCDVACKLDVYNDVTSAYQWYSYRRCGMLIGLTEQTRTDNGRTTAKADFLTTKDCTVVYGPWAEYTYCEFKDMENMGARYPWVRVQEGLYNGAYSNARYGNPIVNGETVTDDNHQHLHREDDSCQLQAAFHQLYGGGQGCYGGNWHIGNGVTEYFTYGDGTRPPEYETKFATKMNEGHVIISGVTLTLGQIFESLDVDTAIQNLDVHAYVTAMTEGDTAGATFSKNNSDWTKSTLTFTGEGMAIITISDYYYCTPTTLRVSVKSSTELVSVTDAQIVGAVYEQREDENGNTVWVELSPGVPYIFECTTSEPGTVRVDVGECEGSWRFRVLFPDGQWSSAYSTYSTNYTDEVSFRVEEAGSWKIKFYTYDSTVHAIGDGTVSFTVSFAPDSAADVEITPYEVSTTVLALGENALTLEKNTNATIYKFKPTAVGTYTFTAPEGAKVGLWGYSTNVLNNPNSESNIFTMDCTNVGPSWYIGVVDAEENFELNITFAEKEPEPEETTPEETTPEETTPEESVPEETQPETEPEPDPSEPAGEVVTVGNSTDLSEALKATAGTTIKLTGDITTSFTVESGKDIILDLNGYTLTANKSSGGVITVEGTLTIQDTSAEGDGLIQNTSTSSDRGIVVSDGSLTVKSGNITSKTQGVRVDGGSVTVEGGSITATNYGIYAGGTSVVTVNGGTITSGVGTFYNTVYAGSNTNVTITGGYFNGSAPSGGGLITNDGTTTVGHISGGYFTASPSANLLAEGYEIEKTVDAEYPYAVVPKA